MDIDVLIANTLVKVLDITTFACKPGTDKVTFISYRSDELPYGMKEISREIGEDKPDVKQAYLTLKFTNSFMDKVRYAFELVKQVYHIKTSNIVFIDGNNFVISNIKKKNTKIIQLWHASGAIKKFGYDYKRKYTIKNYDYVITSSRNNKDIMASAFGMNTDSILPLGYADADILLKDEIMTQYREELLNTYPQLKGKKVVLYAPTFRGDAIYDKDYLEINVTSIQKRLGDEYVLIYKMHPILGNIRLAHNNYTINGNNIDIYKLFSISDILVSDYSSIIYDFSLLERPVVLYAPDLEKYVQERGVYGDYHRLTPYAVTTVESELIEAIKDCYNMPTEVKSELKRNYFEYTDGNSAKRIAKFALDIIKS